MQSRRPAVTDGEWKLLLNEDDGAGEPELYRIADDPGETVNLIDSARDEARQIHAEMLEWLKAHEATPAMIERLSAARVGLG